MQKIDITTVVLSKKKVQRLLNIINNQKEFEARKINKTKTFKLGVKPERIVSIQIQKLEASRSIA